MVKPWITGIESVSSAQSAAPALGYRWGIRLFLFPARAASEHDKIVNMIPSISHDRNEETPEAKARWFQCLSLSERMELLCAFTDLAFSENADIAGSKDAESTSRRVLVISETRR